MSGKRYFWQGGGGMSSGIIAHVAKGVRDSLSTYKERQDRSRKPFILLVEGMLSRGEQPPPTLIDKMNKYKAELEAEQKGGRTEARS
ncbi:MAG: hypothetical protein QY322_02585 [bacterium]|nr:MAG: hypothetical protein QY322_02585 [bacterium]